MDLDADGEDLANVQGMTSRDVSGPCRNDHCVDGERKSRETATAVVANRAKGSWVFK